MRTVTCHPYILCGAPVLYQKYNNPSGVVACMQLGTLRILHFHLIKAIYDGCVTRCGTCR